MKIAIVGALKIEVERIAESLNDPKTHQFFDSVVYEGMRGEHRIFLTELGVGKVNAALMTQRMIDQFDVDAVINTGIAGSLDDDVDLLDTVFSKDIVYHDFDSGIMKSFAPYTDTFTADETLLQRAIGAVEALRYPYHVGRIATGDEFVTSNARKDDIKSRTEALCVEMEGCAVAHTAYRNQIPFLVVRTISDGANDDAEMTYDEFSKKAAVHAAELILEMF